jgi:hypothetical protein
VSLRDDVVLRAVHQLVEALLRAAGLRKKKDLPAAEEAIGDGLRGLGLSLELVRRVDADTLQMLLPDPDRRAAVRDALLELARCRRDAGDEDDAPRLEHTAHALVSSSRTGKQEG